MDVLALQNLQNNSFANHYFSRNSNCRDMRLWVNRAWNFVFIVLSKNNLYWERTTGLLVILHSELKVPYTGQSQSVVIYGIWRLWHSVIMFLDGPQRIFYTKLLAYDERSLELLILSTMDRSWIPFFLTAKTSENYVKTTDTLLITDEN